MKYYAIYSAFNHEDGRPDVLFRAVFVAQDDEEAYRMARSRIPHIPGFVEDVASVDEDRVELKVMRWDSWEASLTTAWDDFNLYITKARTDE